MATRIGLGLTVLAVTAGAGPALAQADSADPASGAQATQSNPNGRFLGVARVRGTQSAAATDSLLSYHGGPVMHSSKAYAIYWQPSDHYIPPSYKSAISTYFADVAYDSYKNTNVYSVGTQYNDSSGLYAANNVTSGGAFTDTTAYPLSGCTPPPPGPLVCLTDAQLTTELDSYITAHSLPRGLATVYFIFTPPNVGSCFDSGSTSCAFRQYCAYHSSFGAGAGVTLYAHQPFVGRNGGCDTGNSPNGNLADATLNFVSREHNEVMTDPLGTGWWDFTDGSENGDKCNFNFGSGLPDNGLGFYDQVIHADDYYLQLEWSNRGTACLAQNNNRPPTASFTVSPVSPTHGLPATLTATASDADGIRFYEWDFGDGTVGGGVSVSHKWDTAGTKTVKLVVTDNQGTATRVTKVVTVG